MKILTIADIHIGSRPDIKNYFENELTDFVTDFKEKKPDVLVICGDLLDKKLSKDSEFDHYANLFINICAQYCEEIGCLFIILKGTISHDYNQLNSYLHLAKLNKFVKICNTCQEIEWKGCKFLIIPEEYENDKYTFYKDTIYNPEKKYDFVFGHGSFDFACPYSTESGRNSHILFTVKDFENNVYGKVVFGHVHIRVSKANVTYNGSYSRDSFGEEAAKGYLYYEYDIENKKITKEEFIENKKAPIYKTIKEEDIPDNEKEMFDYLNNTISKCFKLRVIVTNECTQSKYNNLVAYSYKNLDFIIKKVNKGFSKEEKEKNEEVEKRREERKTKLEKYKDMNFFDITKSIAKDNYHLEFSTEEISEAIK